MLENYCGAGTRYTSDKMVFISGNVFAYTCDYTGAQLCYRSESATANSEYFRINLHMFLAVSIKLL
jgi:hypothetical protein